MDSTTDELNILREEVRRLRALEQIRGRIYAYARAIDRLDGELLADQFWPDAQVEYGSFYQGPVAGFVPVALRFQQAMRDTQHLIGNTAIEISGDQACAESYVHAHHVLLEEDRLVQLVVGARYLDRFECRSSQWKLKFRTEVMDWGRWLPISERWFELANELPKGLRGRADLSYRFSLREP